MKLIAPNGKRIVGTAESMLVTYGIDVLGRNPDGSINFEHNGENKEYDETAEQRTDENGESLFTDEDGVDWPESRLTLVEDAS